MKRKNIGTLGQIGCELSDNEKTLQPSPGVQPDVHGILEKYLSCNKREDVRTLSQVGHEVSDNEKMLQPSCGVRHLESVTSGSDLRVTRNADMRRTSEAEPDG